MTKDQLFKKYIAKIRSTRGRIDRFGNPIEFKISFNEWCQIWAESGKTPQQPWVLSRHGDIGHYEMNNVYVQHNKQNVMEQHHNDDYQKAITELTIKTGYRRTMVRKLIAKGVLKV
jgi:hypothetical protein